MTVRLARLTHQTNAGTADAIFTGLPGIRERVFFVKSGIPARQGEGIKRRFHFSFFKGLLWTISCLRQTGLSVTVPVQNLDRGLALRCIEPDSCPFL